MEIIYFISDSNAHGKLFCGFDDHNEEEQRLINIVQEMARNELNLICQNVLINDDENGCKKNFARN